MDVHKTSYDYDQLSLGILSMAGVEGETAFLLSLAQVYALLSVAAAVRSVATAVNES